MANRSDINSALPRHLKRMILMGKAAGHIKDGHHYGAVKSLFVQAHAIYKKHKQNKRLDIKYTETIEDDSASTVSV